MASCGNSGPKPNAETRLPPIPAGIAACLDREIAAPTRGNKRAIAALIEQFRRNDVAKTRCGRRLIAYYENIKKGLAQ